MRTFYYHSSSLSSIDEAEAERVEHHPVVVEIEGELEFDTSPLANGATRPRRRLHRQSRSSSATRKDPIGSSIGRKRRISFECHSDEILMAIVASTSELSIYDDESSTALTPPRRRMPHYRNNGGQSNHMTSMVSLIGDDLNDSVSGDRESMYNVLGRLDEAILRYKAGRVRRSSSRRRVPMEVAE